MSELDSDLYYYVFELDSDILLEEIEGEPTLSINITLTASGNPIVSNTLHSFDWVA